MSADVDEGEEVYTDGTSITNITVAGVKDKITMFGAGGKPGVAAKPLKPVMQRFMAQAEENNQNIRNFDKPAGPGSAPGPKKISGSPAAANGGPPPKPKPSLSGKPSETPTDHNKNITIVPPSGNKRGSVNIPNAFLKNSNQPPTERKISIDEKPGVQNVPKPSTPQPPVSSTPSINKADDKPEPDAEPKHDFRANLRKMDSRSGVPKPIEINPRQRTPSGEEKPLSPPGSRSSVKTPAAKLPKRITPTKTVVTRKDDGKKFERLAKSVAITTDLAPIKPLKPRDISIKDIIEEFKKAYDDFKYANEELYDDVGNYIREEVEEEYDDVANVIEPRRHSKRASNRPVSEIAEWTEEDELGSGGSASVSGSGGSAAVLTTTQEETYDDGIQVEDDEELYEPLDEDDGILDKKEQEKREKEAAERRKKEDREKKEQEKKDKADQARKLKEDKARLEKEKKKEKEMKELRKKLKMTGDEQTEAHGVVKDKAKGGKLDLALQARDNVDIIRMTDNPKGKWLVRTSDGSVGYVESDNILIQTPDIKQAMKLVDNPHAEGDDGPEEMYEDLDGYQEDMEGEIYEECS